MIFFVREMDKCSKLLIDKIKYVCEKEFRSKHEISCENNEYIVRFTNSGHEYSAILINLTQENSWGIRETLSKFNNMVNGLLNKMEKCVKFDMNVYSDPLINGMYV